MIGRTDSAAEKKKRDGVKRVVEWLEDLLPEEEKDEEFGGKAPAGKETNVICNQLECKEPGCPPVELVMTLLRAKPKQKLMFKIFKAASEVTREEVDAAMKRAIAEEAGGHDHGHADGKHADGCCGHDHDEEKAEHGHHDHGHAEKKADHGHADGKHADGCCGHDNDEKEKAHEHGHGAEKADHGHKHSGGCCGGDEELPARMKAAQDAKSHAHGHSEEKARARHPPASPPASHHALSPCFAQADHGAHGDGCCGHDHAEKGAHEHGHAEKKDHGH
ncbi:hypothetical protein EMIHUDRAFT_98554 [Emiliania huxleyi CCMP1516]|uniref:Uncharacterized protein n=2 Tax=Emiliania huxleyi TaxID=2903 RepID=A0A0D3KIG8_EMIH1|nr:hypothetical protein EMIHUDRAFT_98554 [Emiliania huxleyi CCMP1516]EOD35553.1 hypothetical protein EMIHUDRAFT_98554 [Emiliania huxleyi CCMP1516]|eukprot:XP_005787982.1 hypothetical protein EMIHUDRAFT_98554 [Emiliania huxleyi CCMP1516]